MARTFFAVFVVLFCPLTAEGQGAREQDYPAIYSSAPMIRNAALIDTGLRLTERGVDAAVDGLTGDLFVRKSAGGFTVRLSRWLAFDFFVMGIGSILGHELGHDTRSEELGRPARVHIRSFNASFFSASGAPFTAAETLTVWSAGFEGARVLSDRVERRIYTQNRATPGDLSLIFMTVVGAEQYLLRNLSDRGLESPAAFLGSAAGGRIGDPKQYASGLAALRRSHAARFTREEIAIFFPEIQATSRELRRASLLNFVDLGLIIGSAELFHGYMWNGRRDLNVRWLRLGAVRVVPSLRYELTPNGPEHQVRSRYRAGSSSGLAYVRWTSPLDASAAGAHGTWGVGGEWTRASSARIEPRITADLWTNPDGSTRGRVEVGASTRGWLHHRLTFGADVGLKGAGYLHGYPLKSGPYFGVGAAVRF